MPDEYQEYMAHFASDISEEIKQYATEEVFKHSRYIFTHRKGKHQYGYCTHCQKTFRTVGLKHNTGATCPMCQSKCTVKASGISRKYMVDDAYFVWYEKSLINPNIIVARGIYAVRDYTGLYWNVETQYKVRAYYVFKMGNSVMMGTWCYYSQAKTMEVGKFTRCKSVFSLYSQYNNKVRYTALEYSKESIENAVKDTPFRFSTWESYDYEDMVRFFDLYSRYPCVEYLTKLGFDNLVYDKLTDERTYGAINWRGKNLFKILKITKKDLNEIKAQNIDVSFLFLRILQISKRDGSNFTLQEISQIENGQYGIEQLLGVLKHTSLRKAVSYIKKQYKKDNKEHYYHEHQVQLAWRDYIVDCDRLQLDLTKESVLFPGNLYRAHQNTIKQIKLYGDKLLDEKIRTRIEALSLRYFFEYQGLFIRPAGSTKELIDEGKALNHCVGTYGDGYASGKNTILFIRATAEPDRPFYTMELKGDKIIQVYGLKNRNPDKKVQKFIEAFKAEKLTKQKPKVRVRVPA